jgi:succinate dehydrogenase flavin-adding protein (antitoxin of CptAB toxin-antitoxin module)
LKKKINADIKRLEKQCAKYTKRDEDTSEIEKDIDYLKSILDIKNSDLQNLIQKKGRYDELSPEDKTFLDKAIDMIKKPNPKTEDALRSLDYDIDQNRTQTKGQVQKLNAITKDNLVDTYTGKHKDIKSKNGIRVIGNVNVTEIPSEVAEIIKKIANIITATLSPMAQTLYDARFRGLLDQDKITISTLYSDMDEKMYILTTLNNTKNAQLMKLDKEFDKLYNLVKTGMDLFVPPSYTGGSIGKALITNHLCLL